MLLAKLFTCVVLATTAPRLVAAVVAAAAVVAVAAFTGQASLYETSSAARNSVLEEQLAVNTRGSAFWQRS